MPAKLETERKFIILLPDVCELAKMPEYTRSEITQIYIDAPSGITHRTRRRRYDDRTEYTETVKIRINRMTVNEDECLVGEERFEELRTRMAEGTRALEKVRHTFKLHGYTYEIDVYPDWKSTCILEVELENPEADIPMPNIIHIVNEVTGEKRYSNASMSRCFPDEEKV